MKKQIFGKIYKISNFVYLDSKKNSLKFTEEFFLENYDNSESAFDFLVIRTDSYRFSQILLLAIANNLSFSEQANLLE
jgi:hypothetical protein